MGADMTPCKQEIPASTQKQKMHTCHAGLAVFICREIDGHSSSQLLTCIHTNCSEYRSSICLSLSTAAVWACSIPIMATYAALAIAEL